jgi:ketosteroid isomerase-like protein
MARLLLAVALAACASPPPPPVTPASAPPPARYDRSKAAEEVRAAEIAFAKAFADRDATRFVAMLDADATFIGPRRTLHGRDEVHEGWRQMLEAPQPPFSWAPERIEISGDGMIGLSSGPVKAPDGTQVATFSSIWRRQTDGTWKVIFDGPGCQK